MTNPETCLERRETIAALVLGELPPPQADELKRHMQDCPACAAFFEKLTAQEDDLRSAFDAIARGVESTASKVETFELLFPLETHRASALTRLMKGIHNMPRPRKILVAAATFAVVFTGLASWFVTGRPGIAMALADIQDKLSVFRPYACTYTYEYTGKPPFSYRELRRSLAQRREERSDGTIVVFVDPRLTTLTDVHLRALMEPLYAGTTRAVLGLTPGESPFAHLVARLAGARFTTERAYLRGDLLRHLLRMAKTGSGLEAYLNGLFKKEEVLVVPLAGLQRLGTRVGLPRSDAARESAGEAAAIARVILGRTLKWGPGVADPHLQAIPRRSPHHRSP